MTRTTTIPYFKFDAGQFLAETMGLPDATVGLYSRLMALYWVGNCRLPERADLECRLGIKTKQQRERLNDVLQKFFPGDESNHPRLDMCQYEAQEASQKQRERAQKRWNKEDPKKAESTLADNDF